MKQLNSTLKFNLSDQHVYKIYIHAAEFNDLFWVEDIYIYYGFLSTIMSKKEGKYDLTSSEVHAAIASHKTSENAAVVFVVMMCLYWTVW